MYHIRRSKIEAMETIKKKRQISNLYPTLPPGSRPQEKQNPSPQRVLLPRGEMGNRQHSTRYDLTNPHHLYNRSHNRKLHQCLFKIMTLEGKKAEGEIEE